MFSLCEPRLFSNVLCEVEIPDASAFGTPHVSLPHHARASSCRRLHLRCSGGERQQSDNYRGLDRRLSGGIGFEAPVGSRRWQGSPDGARSWKTRPELSRCEVAAQGDDRKKADGVAVHESKHRAGPGLDGCGTGYYRASRVLWMRSLCCGSPSNCSVIALRNSGDEATFENDGPSRC